MTIEKIESGDALILKVEGKVDAANGEEFSEQVIEACHSDGLIRLDLTGVPYFSSAGLRGLLMGYKVSKLKGGRFELYGVNDTLMDILKSTGLDKELIICSGDADSPQEPSVADAPVGSEREEAPDQDMRDVEYSPAWVAALPEARDASQLFIVAVHEKTTAWLSLHEKDKAGNWHILMSAIGFIGVHGLGEKGEEGKTPKGSYLFERSFITSFDRKKPFTDGKIALHQNDRSLVLSRVADGCVVVADTLNNLGGSF